MPESGWSDLLIRLFVYGTLRPPRAGSLSTDSRGYPEIAPYVVSARSAQLPHAVLYNLGAYPGARPGSDTVVGNLLCVDPEALIITDRIEGHPRFFVRRRARVRSEACLVDAWVYWAPESLCAGKPLIPGSDWFAR